MKIVLLGYMGSGKSTIGASLARHLAMDFIDLDDYISQREGKSINEIFAQRGVIYFRKIEALCLRALIAEPSDMVIALGGGTPVYGDNMNFLKETPKVTTCYLKLPIDILTQRLWESKATRPLISDINNIEELEEFIRKHLFERVFVYQGADHVVVGKNQSPEELVQVIAELLNQ